MRTWTEGARPLTSGSPCAVVLIGVLSLAPVVGPLADPLVEQAYGSYYQDLAGFGRSDLERELEATIDDALLSGSHLGRPSTAQKRQEIAQATLSDARGRLCGPGPAGTEVREACILGTRRAAEAATVRFNPESIGMVAAVCARLLELEAPAGRCGAP
ncbi:MAG: hypothetical protein ACM3ST_03835 [Bdellovibrio bacteriovorus]